MKRKTIKILVLLLLAILLTQCRSEDRFYSNVLRSDVFVQLFDDTKYDFLWVFDNSVSMKTKRDYVKDNMNSFLQTLQSRKAIDYQMAVVTTDYFSHAGALVSSPSGIKVVSSLSADPVGDFAAVVNNVQNSGTSFWEQGLESAYEAIYSQGNEFIREGVPLIIIFLTDEDDYSCESNCFGIQPEHQSNWNAFSVDRYINLLKNLNNNDGNEVSVFPIVGTSGSTCTVPSLGDRYVAVQEGVGGFGVAGSICSQELPESYENIARIIADRGVRFQLNDLASGAGIQVFLDEQLVPYSEDNGYVYDPDSNSIIFSGSYIPDDGQTIEVLYSEQVS